MRSTVEWKRKIVTPEEEEEKKKRKKKEKKEKQEKKKNEQEKLDKFIQNSIKKTRKKQQPTPYRE